MVSEQTELIRVFFLLPIAEAHKTNLWRWNMVSLILIQDFTTSLWHIYKYILILSLPVCFVWISLYFCFSSSSSSVNIFFIKTGCPFIWVSFNAFISKELKALSSFPLKYFFTCKKVHLNNRKDSFCWIN